MCRRDEVVALQLALIAHHYPRQSCCNEEHISAVTPAPHFCRVTIIPHGDGAAVRCRTPLTDIGPHRYKPRSNQPTHSLDSTPFFLNYVLGIAIFSSPASAGFPAWRCRQWIMRRLGDPGEGITIFILVQNRRSFRTSELCNRHSAVNQRPSDTVEVIWWDGVFATEKHIEILLLANGRRRWRSPMDALSGHTQWEQSTQETPWQAPMSGE